MKSVAIAAARLAGRLSRAHHPHCSYFERDVATRWRLCVGCLVMWPLFLTTVIGIYPWLPDAEAGPLLAFGLAMGVPQVFTSFARRADWFRHGAKAVGGVGLGLAFWGWFLLPLPLAPKLWIFAAGLVGMAGLAGLRLRKIIVTCRACPYRMDWETCPGMLGHGSAPDPALIQERVKAPSAVAR